MRALLGVAWQHLLAADRQGGRVPESLSNANNIRLGRPHEQLEDLACQWTLSPFGRAGTEPSRDVALPGFRSASRACQLIFRGARFADPSTAVRDDVLSRTSKLGRPVLITGFMAVVHVHIPCGWPLCQAAHGQFRGRGGWIGCAGGVCGRSH